MKTFRQFIEDYCYHNGLIPNNVPNDTFIDIVDTHENLSFKRRKDVVTFRCNKAELTFTKVGNYLTCN